MLSFSVVQRFVSYSCNFSTKNPKNSHTVCFLTLVFSFYSLRILVHQTKLVKAVSHLPSRTYTPLLWRTFKSQISSMKTQSAVLHLKPPSPLELCWLLLWCQVRGKTFTFLAVLYTKNMLLWYCYSSEEFRLINV